MLNIKSLIAATLLTGVAALSFAQTAAAPKPAAAVAPAATTVAPAADSGKPVAKKVKKVHIKKVKAEKPVKEVISK
jgi:hypothetical protein